MHEPGYRKTAIKSTRLISMPILESLSRSSEMLAVTATVPASSRVICFERTITHRLITRLRVSPDLTTMLIVPPRRGLQARLLLILTFHRFRCRAHCTGITFAIPTVSASARQLPRTAAFTGQHILIPRYLIYQAELKVPTPALIDQIFGCHFI